MSRSGENVRVHGRPVITNIDLLAVDLQTALHHLGMLTGSISSDELLGNIFGEI